MVKSSFNFNSSFYSQCKSSGFSYKASNSKKIRRPRINLRLKSGLWSSSLCTWDHRRRGLLLPHRLGHHHPVLETCSGDTVLVLYRFIVSFEEVSLNWLAHVADEKSIPSLKIDILWAMGDSIPDLVPTRFLAPMARLKFRPLPGRLRNLIPARFLAPPELVFLNSLWGLGTE